MLIGSMGLIRVCRAGTDSIGSAQTLKSERRSVIADCVSVFSVSRRPTGGAVHGILGPWMKSGPMLD
jgi:hypothetical protein